MKQNNSSNNKSWFFSIFLGIILFFIIQKVLELYQVWGIAVYFVWILILSLAVILFVETVLKKALLKTLDPANFTEIDIDFNDDLANVDTAKLKFYNSELIRLGFNKLIDFAIPETVGLVRLYHHSEHHYFAEVGCLQNCPVFCSIMAAYEEDWSFSISNQQPSPSMKAISYAFLRSPRDVSKYLVEKPEFLLNTFLAWNKEITEALNINAIAANTSVAYFALNNQRRVQQKRALMKKSITWCLIEVLLFLRNPKSEWLGDYKKIRFKQKLK